MFTNFPGLGCLVLFPLGTGVTAATAGLEVLILADALVAVKFVGVSIGETDDLICVIAGVVCVRGDTRRGGATVGVSSGAEEASFRSGEGPEKAKIFPARSREGNGEPAFLFSPEECSGGVRVVLSDLRTGPAGGVTCFGGSAGGASAGGGTAGRAGGARGWIENPKFWILCVLEYPS